SYYSSFIILFVTLCASRSTLFPYTTLFRSGFSGVADIAYLYAFRQAEREHKNDLVRMRRANLIMCQNPECCWEAQYFEETPEVMAEVFNAFALHPCPLNDQTMAEFWEEDEDE